MPDGSATILLDSPHTDRAVPPLSAAPTARQLVTLFTTTFALRLLIVAIVCWRGHMTLDYFARLYDGRSYLITARAILGDTTDFNDYHGRVFFGLPLAIAALARLGIPIHLAALLLNWTSASAAAVLSARLFKDLRVGYATALLFPHALMNACLTASESPMLALTLAALLLLQNKNRFPWDVAAGALFAAAMLFRPMAVFALLATAVYDLSHRRCKRPVTLGLTTAVIFSAGLLLQSHFRHGDPLANFRYQAHSPNAYAGQLLNIPFKALLLYPLTSHLPPVRIAYLWLHAAVILTAALLALRQFRANRLAATWLLLNTAFILSLGPPWGFQCFHRFSIPAAPAMWYFLRRYLPSANLAWLWLPIAATSATIAAITILNEAPGW